MQHDASVVGMTVTVMVFGWWMVRRIVRRWRDEEVRL